MKARRASILTVTLLASACAASDQRSLLPRPRVASFMDVADVAEPEAGERLADAALDDEPTDRRASDVASPRRRASVDAGAHFDGPPSSFAELLDTERPVFWRVQSSRGPTCVQWTPRRTQPAQPPDSLASSVRIRCVTYTTTVRVLLRSERSLVLRGVGGSVMTRIGGGGWMRPSAVAGHTIDWVESDEHRVLTSEGDWYLNEQACAAATSTVPSSRPPLWRADAATRESLTTATSLEELRWVIASEVAADAPPEISQGVVALLRDRALVWEPAPDRRRCRSWRVTIERDNVVLSREAAFRPRVRRVLQQHMRWNPSCGELECGGCSHYLIGPNVGSTGGSSSERRYSVDRVGAGWIESSEQRAYSTREACMRADALRRGPLFSDCDDP